MSQSLEVVLLLGGLSVAQSQPFQSFGELLSDRIAFGYLGLAFYEEIAFNICSLFLPAASAFRVASFIGVEVQ